MDNYSKNRVFCESRDQELIYNRPLRASQRHNIFVFESNKTSNNALKKSLRQFSSPSTGICDIDGDAKDKHINGHGGKRPPGEHTASFRRVTPIKQGKVIPKWSYHKRILPTHLIELSSRKGKKMFLDSLMSGDAESYFPLAEQFITQGEPAYCGLSTLAMVLNALSIDPNIRWKGGWRWFDEEMVVNSCCVKLETVKKQGITLDQFHMMGRCNGARVTLHRPNIDQADDVETFRSHVRRHVRCETWSDGEQETSTTPTNTKAGFLVVSYARSALGQTGDGHFSPIAAYYAATDQVLILDVARFKYAPYWVPLESLYHAMTFTDEATKLTRGWCEVHAPLQYASSPPTGRPIPSELVHTMQMRDQCPVNVIKVHFCSIANGNMRTAKNTKTN